MVRKSKGRQKVEMVKMPNESNLQVTFSKRRSGLFKKASELCTLCGAEVALVVFSPGKKVLGELEAEKKRGEELIQMRKASQAQCWWENPIEELSLPQLEQLKAALEELKKNVAKQAEKIMIQNSGPPQFLGASSSSGGGINLPFDLQSAGFNPNMMPPHGYNNPGFGRGFY
ncbi:hypothetical protein Pint_33607 [Pistacia integerrima]|uniref:Uncharacterized protein n=1 Tax=Pistacia integerrima TaxID=434235 RepID=A0ACC0X669_9ROSI|nr:hypothetical protein Pint_33607 [Pistacia integerrima]